MDRFEVTEDHLKLMKRSYVRWDDCEFGAASIDSKRPYGNGAVIADIAEILESEAKLCPHCGDPIEDVDEDYFNKIHLETETVLQIALHVGFFKTGIYEIHNRYWKKMSEAES